MLKRKAQNGMCQHFNTFSYCRYAECRYAECRGAQILASFRLKRGKRTKPQLFLLSWNVFRSFWRHNTLTNNTRLNDTLHSIIHDNYLLRDT